MKKIIMMAISILLTGCGANFFAAKTTATYQVSPDGTKLISYDSNKEQQGLDLDLVEDQGKIKSVKIHVDKASTQEAVINAVLASQAALLQTLNQIIPMLTKAAEAGALAGS